jgi:hypothetical protein
LEVHAEPKNCSRRIHPALVEREEARPTVLPETENDREEERVGGYPPKLSKQQQPLKIPKCTHTGVG